MKSIVILYHADCPDGFGAAWAAWKKFGSWAEYIPVSHSMPPPRGMRGKEIYLVDFSYPAAALSKLRRVNRRVLVIDHHEGAKNVVTRGPEYVYDAAHSGAHLSWRFFHPRKPVPKLVRYLEDVDLWRWKLPRTKEIFCALELEGFDFRRWDRFSRELESPGRRRALLERGRIVSRTEDWLIERIIRFYAEPVRFLGKKIYVVNSPVFESEIGNALYRMHPPLAIVWKTRNGMKTFSVRSTKSGLALKAAKKFGGGGHPQSAGFALPISAPFPWTWLRKQKPTRG